ncbi:histidine phosphatase family protein [Candidatus Saccharibacteria bacterium]|nr:histidine phosphatase family protein [Candidatus Saccharibacteria bacterium]
MKLYLVRHGETDWNLEHKAQGQTDNPLNATGIRQAEELRDKIKGYRFDVCYCSPLKRAVQTMEIILENRDLKIIYDDNLMERNFGSLEGSDTSTWTQDAFDLKINSKEGGMESNREVLARSKKVLDRIKSENPPDARVLIVAHDFLLRTLYFNIVGYTDDSDFHSVHFKNSSITEFEI